MSPRVKPFMWKWVWFAWKWTCRGNTFLYIMVSHEDLFWHRGKKQLTYCSTQKNYSNPINELYMGASRGAAWSFMAVIIAIHLCYKRGRVLAVWNPMMYQMMKKRHEDSPSDSDQTECELHGSLHCSENSCNANKTVITFNISLPFRQRTLYTYL